MQRAQISVQERELNEWYAYAVGVGFVCECAGRYVDCGYSVCTDLQYVFDHDAVLCFALAQYIIGYLRGNVG